MSSPGTPRALVLVVDDQPVLRTVLRDLLEHDGFDVVDTDSPEGAVDAVTHQDIALAIIDLGLRVETGQETAARLRVVRPGLPVIYMSGYPIVDARSLDGEPLLQKPFGAHELIDAVRKRLAAG
jgi:CheY-like chemotaxis protein